MKKIMLAAVAGLSLGVARRVGLQRGANAASD